jgi:alkyl hydroperoxide reductase subunit D
MTLNDLARTLPDYAKDLRLNLSSLLNEQGLTDQQKYGTIVACAHAASYRPLIAAAEEEAGAKIAATALTAAKAAASIMAMNNIYYRFLHLSSNKEYATRPAKLRMNVIGAPGIDKADFERFFLAVSAINGCGMCIDAHEKVLQAAGVSLDTIQTAVRIAAVVHAIARSLQALPEAVAQPEAVAA